MQQKPKDEDNLRLKEVQTKDKLGLQAGTQGT